MPVTPKLAALDSLQFERLFHQDGLTAQSAGTRERDEPRNCRGWKLLRHNWYRGKMPLLHRQAFFGPGVIGLADGTALQFRLEADLPRHLVTGEFVAAVLLQHFDIRVGTFA